MSTTNLTTTNIGKEELKHLRKQSSQHGLKQVEFINAAINYFRKTGINPAEKIYSPREEIEMLRKRLEEVIKYLQVHEKQKLGPLMERLILLEKKLSEGYAESNTKSDIKGLSDFIKNEIEYFSMILKEIIRRIDALNDQVDAKLLILSQDSKTIIGLIGLLFEALQNKKMGGFKEIDIKNFQDALSQVR